MENYNNCLLFIRPWENRNECPNCFVLLLVKYSFVIMINHGAKWWMVQIKNYNHIMFI